MLDSNESNRIAAAYERVVAKQFKKLGYVVERLDRKSSKRPRPDFLIKDRDGCRQMLCEVKTVLSAGYLLDRHAHVSMQDENLADTGPFKTEIDLTGISEGLADAVRKGRELGEDDSTFADLPLLVAFGFDFFADFLHFYPRTFDENISGILTIKENAASTKTSKDFVLVRNKNKRALRVPKDFLLWCLTEGYGESM